MTSRFQPDNDSSANDPASGLNESESFDTNERMFETSLEQTAPKFVIEGAENLTTKSHNSPLIEKENGGLSDESVECGPSSEASEHLAGKPSLDPASDAWREQIAAKVNH